MTSKRHIGKMYGCFAKKMSNNNVNVLKNKIKFFSAVAVAGHFSNWLFFTAFKNLTSSNRDLREKILT